MNIGKWLFALTTAGEALLLVLVVLITFPFTVMALGLDGLILGLENYTSSLIDRCEKSGYYSEDAIAKMRSR